MWASGLLISFSPNVLGDDSLTGDDSYLKELVSGPLSAASEGDLAVEAMPARLLLTLEARERHPR